MKKILERAKVQRDRYVNFPRIKDSELLLIESSYVTGATEQREIDIQRACEWLKENKDKYCYNTGGKDEYIPKCSDKLIDDFKQAMKGE